MTLAPLQIPTFYFIGVSTEKSSIMKVFPRWSEILSLETQLVGYDAPLHAPDEIYRAIVHHIKHDPLARGALVTTHKIDLLNAARDLFDHLDTYAQLCGEISCISKREGRLEGYAKDPISSGLTWHSFVEAGHWGRTGADVMCIGSGGAAVAISVHAASQTDNPRRFLMIDVSEERLNHARDIMRQMKTDTQLEYILNGDAAANDQLMASLPAGSMVINATGMGKDRPGSPITDNGRFPETGLVWELNYRGELLFLQQAQRQIENRHLRIEDGWLYFLHGWTQVVAEAFHLDLTPALFQKLGEAASEIRV